MKSLRMVNPTLYHLQHREENEDVPFWMQLAEEMDGPVLELGCGTGRLLLPILKSGVDVYGLDWNFEMLSYLKQQFSPQLQRQAKIFQADLGKFHLDREFSFIFLACNTLSTLHEETRRSGYARIYEHLSDKGIFAVSIPNPVHLASLPSPGEPEIEETFSHPMTGDPIQISSEWHRFDQFVDFFWHYDQLKPDGTIERQTVRCRHYLISPEEYQKELRRANLDPIKMYGDFDKVDYHKDSPHLIMIIRKNPGF